MLAFAASAIEVMLARSVAWLGRGLRTPGRKALLAAAVPQEAYGRAFGFERMMDTLGAIVAPVTALWLLGATGHSYRRVFLWTLVPGLLAALSFAVLVRERRATKPPAWRPSPRACAICRRIFAGFLVAVGAFGLGDFSHTMLILYATRTLAPEMGLAAASSVAVGLYLLHNIFYAAFAYVGGWLSDRATNRRLVLAGGFVTAIAMAALLVAGEVFGHAGGAVVGTQRIELAAVFALAGIFVGVNEALEDSIAASLVTREQHGMAFGTMAAVNAVGDFGSSVLSGAVERISAGRGLRSGRRTLFCWAYPSSAPEVAQLATRKSRLVPGGVAPRADFARSLPVTGPALTTFARGAMYLLNQSTYAAKPSLAAALL